MSPTQLRVVREYIADELHVARYHRPLAWQVLVQPHTGLVLNGLRHLDRDDQASRKAPDNLCLVRPSKKHYGRQRPQAPSWDSARNDAEQYADRKFQLELVPIALRHQGEVKLEKAERDEAQPVGQVYCEALDLTAQTPRKPDQQQEYRQGRERSQLTLFHDPCCAPLVVPDQVDE